MSRVLVAAVLATAALAGAGCGGGAHGRRPPTTAERTQIVHWMRFWWRNDDAFAAVRTFRPSIGTIRVSRRDGHFATVAIHAVDPAGRQHPEPQTIGLMEWGGLWEIVVGPGDWSGTCTSPSPAPLVELYCPRPSS